MGIVAGREVKLSTASFVIDEVMIAPPADPRAVALLHLDHFPLENVAR
jgi:hypothetical protein